MIEKGNHENKCGRRRRRRNQNNHYHSNDDYADHCSTSSSNKIIETGMLTEYRYVTRKLHIYLFTPFCHSEQCFSIFRAIPVNSLNYLNYLEWLYGVMHIKTKFLKIKHKRNMCWVGQNVIWAFYSDAMDKPE